MPLGFKKPIDPDDPRLAGHKTTYQASRGGWYPPSPQQQDGEERRKAAENSK